MWHLMPSKGLSTRNIFLTIICLILPLAAWKITLIYALAIGSSGQEFKTHLKLHLYLQTLAWATNIYGETHCPCQTKAMIR